MTLFLFLFLVVLKLDAQQLPKYVQFKNSSQCPSYDLNAGSNSPLRKIPVYDQDGYGMCYAYTAAQLVDFYRIKAGDKSYDLTNPSYAAWLTYYKSRFLKAGSLRAGYQTEVVDALRKYGSCTNHDVTRRLSALTKHTGGSESELMTFLDIAYNNRGGFFREPNDWKSVSSSMSSYIEMGCSQKNALKDELSKMELYSVSTSEVLEKMFDGCRPKKVNVPELISINQGTDRELRGIIEGALAKGYPTGLSMCGNALHNSQLRGLGPALISRENPKDICGPHAVLAVAQANINGECNVMIRNSWGADWYGETATTCACITHSNAYKSSCTREEAKEVVGCWFRYSDILPNTGSVDVFKN